MDVIEGNLLDMAEEGEFDIIVHGCNCFHKMGSGIAKQIATRYPHIEDIDFSTQYGSKEKLGNFSYGRVQGINRTSFILVNAYTQYKWSGVKDVFEYKAFDKFLNRLCGFSYAIHETKESVVKIGFPMIGCGKACGNKDKILASLRKFSEDVRPWASVRIVVFDKA